MKKTDVAENSSILEAVDNLSSMAEIDIDEFKVDKGESESLTHIQTSHWLDLKNEEKTVQSVKDTFKTVHNYLKYVYKKEGSQIKDKEVQKGVKSIIQLATEAAQKVDQCVQLFHDKSSITNSKEFRELMDFYEGKLLKKFEEVLQSEEEWEEEWSEDGDAADIKRRGLKDLETVTKDRDYELFYILKEDGTKFYNKNLIRHIRLVADFDQIINSLSGDDPFLRVRMIQDKIAQEEATYIKRHIHSELDHWIKKAGKFRDNYFVQIFYRSMMALMLAANPRNMLVHKVEKSAISYLRDFHHYFRAVLDSVEYQQFVQSASSEVEPFFEELLALIHKICFTIYMKPVDYNEAFNLLSRVLRKDKKPASSASLSLWNQIIDDYEVLYGELKKHPNGPLFKVLDILHSGDEKEGFDPYMQEDRPVFLGSVQIQKREVGLILGAAPTHQRQIDKAKVIGEFFGCLRHAKHEKKKFLLINLQDRTSWKEFVRCHTLEEFQKSAEVSSTLDVITLPKETGYYLQADEYLKMADATEFKRILFEQVKSGEVCGFSFPKEYAKESFYTFVKKCIDWIHIRFFGQKHDLSRKNRLDCIEILYNCIIMHFIQVTEADYVFFAGKDSVDAAAVAASGFYAFIKLLSTGIDWKEEEKELFFNTIFLPAFLVRERTVDVRTMNREISMLSVVSGELEVNKHKLIKELSALGLS